MFSVAAARGAESLSNMTELEGGSELFSHVGQECLVPDFLSRLTEGENWLTVVGVIFGIIRKVLTDRWGFRCDSKERGAENRTDQPYFSILIFALHQHYHVAASHSVRLVFNGEL